jgi:hypothetical protein
MSSAWKDYKEKIGTARPWHLLNSDNYVDDQLSSARYEVCLACPELIDLTKQCKQCGCFMPGKVKLKQAECPIKKWI